MEDYIFTESIQEWLREKTKKQKVEKNEREKLLERLDMAQYLRKGVTTLLERVEYDMEIDAIRRRLNNM